MSTVIVTVPFRVVAIFSYCSHIKRALILETKQSLIVALWSLPVFTERAAML